VSGAGGTARWGRRSVGWAAAKWWRERNRGWGGEMLVRCKGGREGAAAIAP